MNISVAGHMKRLGEDFFFKETPNPPLKAAVGFVYLIRVPDTPLAPPLSVNSVQMTACKH